MKKMKVKDSFMRQPFSVFIFVLLIVYVISFLFPLFWAFLTSFKDQLDFISNKFGLPTVWHFENYPTVFNELYIRISEEDGQRKVYAWEMIWNALFYSVFATGVSTMSHCVSSYAAARYNKYAVCRMLYPIVIVTMVLPIIGALGAELNFLRAIGAYDNVIMLCIMKGGFLGSNFLIFYATFKGISWEYAEAAFIDGASHARVLFTIMIPLAMTSIGAIFLLGFIGNWNNWNVNVIYLPNYPMISYALYYFQKNTINAVSSTPAKLAACMYQRFTDGVVSLKKLCDGLEITLRDFFDDPLFDEIEQEIK